MCCHYWTKKTLFCCIKKTKQILLKYTIFCCNLKQKQNVHTTFCKTLRNPTPVYWTWILEYGRGCADIGCLPTEECVLTSDSCSYNQRDGKDCGSYPTCKKKVGGGVSTSSSSSSVYPSGDYFWKLFLVIYIIYLKKFWYRVWFNTLLLVWC